MNTNERAAKIYTRTGDKGKTSLIGGSRVSKNHLRLDTYGTVDELNSFIGALRAEIRAEIGAETSTLTSTVTSAVTKPERTGAQQQSEKLTALDSYLSDVQHGLFDLGSHLACEDAEMREQLPKLAADAIETMEKKMDELSLELTPLKNFILPGGSRSASLAHIARTVCRRSERLCVALIENGESIDSEIVRYLNRLSDFLFVAARFLNFLQGVSEPIWAPRKPKQV